MEDEKSFQGGLIVMGDLPMQKLNVLKGQHDRARRHTIQEMEAQQSIQKEIEIKGERGLKSSLDRR
jgi:hypothetical protein